MYKDFMKQPAYLANYHRAWALGLIATNIALFSTIIVKMDKYSFETFYFLPAVLALASVRIERVILALVLGWGAVLFTGGVEFTELLLIPLAFTVSLSLSGLIHCASHGSIRPRLLNRPVGELCGLAQLSGFADWKIVHILHHSHTDDPVRDPHPPQSLSYWDYTKNMRNLILKAFVAKYFQLFTQSDASVQHLKNFSRFSRIAHVQKILFWFMILGPKVFALFFIPSIVSKMFQFSWLNWAAHRPGPQGIEVRNLQNWKYAYLNFFSFGLYIHKSHHLAPTLFNPKSYVEKENRIAS